MQAVEQRFTVKIQRADCGPAFYSPLVHVHLCLLAADVREAASNTADGGQSKHDLLLTIDVGVQHTQNVLKRVIRHQGLRKRHTRQSAASQRRARTQVT